jgi:hypothetical protein
LRFAGIAKNRKDARIAKTLGNKELGQRAFTLRRALLQEYPMLRSDPNDPPKPPADPEPIDPEIPQEDPAEEPDEMPDPYPSEAPRFDEPF